MFDKGPGRDRKDRQQSPAELEKANLPDGQRAAA